MITPTPEFWKVFKETEGALSCTEAVAIVNIAAQAPGGVNCLEMGTYKGKSACAALIGLKEGGFFHLLEPEFSDPYFLDEAHKSIRKTKKITGKKITCLLSNAYSTDFIERYDNYCYVFSDAGNHQDGLPMQEVKLLEDRMISGGIIAFHDFKSQFVEVEGAYNYLLSTGKYDEIKIDWDEIISYVKENDLETGNSSWHHNEIDFPCFVGAVKRK